MNKKIMLLALAAVSATVLALPAMASASIPLHLTPTPVGEKEVHGGVATLTAPGSTITCTSVKGGVTFEAGGTTGNMNLNFVNCSTFGGFVPCKSTEPEGAAKEIKTTALPFHLVTLANNKPGVLVTPNASGSFAHIDCAGVLFTVTGNGVIGTIEQTCGTAASSTVINFAAKEGKQEHMTVAGTSTEYDLKKGADTAVQVAKGTVTLGANSTLECT